MKEYLTFDDVGIVPKYSTITSRAKIKLHTKITKNWNIDIPIISAPMDTVTGSDMALTLKTMGGVGAIHRFGSISSRVEMVQTVSRYLSDFPTCASIGVTGTYLEDAFKLIEVGCDILLLDVAHGHHILVEDAIRMLKAEFPHIDIIAGNVSTYEGSKFLENCGADAIRFGQGNGSLCETRIRTGIGIPQISGLLETCGNVSIPVIADGGIRYPGDVAKALAAGASSVMLGSLLAGTKEAPGEISRVGSWPNEILYKKYMGAASLEAKKSRGETKNIEGNSKIIPYKGRVERIITDIVEGLQSACSYNGSSTLEDFINTASLIRVTSAGAIEAKPHLLES